jgi:hypothetical protein
MKNILILTGVIAAITAMAWNINNQAKLKDERIKSFAKIETQTGTIEIMSFRTAGRGCIMLLNIPKNGFPPVAEVDCD